MHFEFLSVSSRFPHTDYASRVNEQRGFHERVASIPYVIYKRWSQRNISLLDVPSTTPSEVDTIASFVTGLDLLLGSYFT